jgi:hypothetical protein
MNTIPTFIPLQNALDKAAESMRKRNLYAQGGGDSLVTVDSDQKIAQVDSLSKQIPLVQLPLWPERVRALPNPLASSALFNVSNKTKNRNYLREHPVECLKGVTIKYTGEELRQRDEDVFLQLLHLARHTSLGESIEFTAYSLLKSLGWSISTRSYVDLRQTLTRLATTTLTIATEDGSAGYGGSLIRKFRWETEDGQKLTKWVVYFEKEIVGLFAPNTYSHIYWELRLSLPPVAKWLHSFYSAHRNPYPYKVETIWKLCGSASSLKHFHATLHDALDTLVEKEFLIEAAIREDGLVHVTRAQDCKPVMV